MLTSLKNAFSAPAAAIALGGVTMLSPIADMAPASAQTVTPIAATQAQVPMEDGRGHVERAIRMRAALVSNDAQVIIYYGDKPEILEALKDGARSIIGEGQLPLKGIILADPKEEVWSGEYLISASQQVEIYTDGLSTTTIENPDLDVQFQLRRMLANDHERVSKIASAEITPDRG